MAGAVVAGTQLLGLVGSRPAGSANFVQLRSASASASGRAALAAAAPPVPLQPLARLPGPHTWWAPSGGSRGAGSLPSWVAAATALPACALALQRRRGRGAAPRLGLRASRGTRGGPSGPVIRQRKREKQEKKEEARFRLDPNRPPPAGASGGPRSGAWTNGRPEAEAQRQGEYKSPYTGQVYDRWAPIGLKQKGTDRQGGLGRSRAYETPQQRKVREALNPDEQVVPEWQKYYPGLAPEHLVPPDKKPKVPPRHGPWAGSYTDLFKQILVQTVVDLKVSKSEAPLWYVEVCGGEGEYHVSRGRRPEDEGPPPAGLRWPTAEALYEVLSKQDMTYMPPELRGWMDAVQLLNQEGDDFEVRGPGAVLAPKTAGIQWLPSTTLMALMRLRKQDPVTLFEDNPIAYAALFNFVRNFSPKLAPHVELTFRDGFRATRRFFVDKSLESKAHGPLNSRRGLVFADADFARGREYQRLLDMVVPMRTHWRAATVVTTYPLNPFTEFKARKYLLDVRESDKSLQLLTAEIYVDNPDWEPEADEPKWRGCGALIASPPHTTAERLRAALGVMCQELSKQPGALEMRVRVEEM